MISQLIRLNSMPIYGSEHHFFWIDFRTKIENSILTKVIYAHTCHIISPLISSVHGQVIMAFIIFLVQVKFSPCGSINPSPLIIYSYTSKPSKIENSDIIFNEIICFFVCDRSQVTTRILILTKRSRRIP